MSQNIFSLEGLISWLETQPPEARYAYHNPRECLMYEYLKERGVPLHSTAGDYWRDKEQKAHHVIPAEINKGIVAMLPFTYGAALQRARELLAEERDVAHQ